MEDKPERPKPIPNYLQSLQSLPCNVFKVPKVTEIKTYRQSHKVTPDVFADSGILGEVIEFPKREEPDDISA